MGNTIDLGKLTDTDAQALLEKLNEMSEATGVSLEFDCQVPGVVLDIGWVDSDTKEAISIQVVRKD